MDFRRGSPPNILATTSRMAAAASFRWRGRTAIDMEKSFWHQRPPAPNAATPLLRSPPDSSPPRKIKRKLGTIVPQIRAHTNPSRDPKRRRRSSGEELRRKWVHSPCELSAFKDRFVLVSYNVLGDGNASKHADLYDRVDPMCLEWEKRKKNICREIARYDAGILCLQEVDHFDDLAELLQKAGFSGCHKGRTGDNSDGCAIFWKGNQFAVLHQESIEFQKFGLRNNVAQLYVFRMNLDDHSANNDGNAEKAENQSARIFIVGNTHVLFNPNRGDIKLGQVRLLLERAHALSRDWGNCPVVIAGDWNCMPQSALYQFLSSSKLDIRMHERQKISSQSSTWKHTVSYIQYGTSRRESASFSRNKFSWSKEEILLAVGREGTTHCNHPLKLFSAYPGVPGSSLTRDDNGEPLVTSYHSRFMGTVDYIWHSPELVPVRVVEMLPIDIIRKTGGLPTKKWGSDHFALVCEFAFESGDEDSR